jgi:hypothetical protein
MDFVLSPSSKHCAFVADLGYVMPLILRGHVHRQMTLDIVPVGDCADDVKADLYKHFSDEWHIQTGAKLEEEVSAFIGRTWSSADLLYVLTVDSKFAGCVAVDRLNFEPCISHLTVVPDKRKMGLSLVLIAIAEAYVKTRLGFAEVCLWCYPDLVEFYSKQGYKKTKGDQRVVVMHKKLGDSTSMTVAPDLDDFVSNFAAF